MRITSGFEHEILRFYQSVETDKEWLAESKTREKLRKEFVRKYTIKFLAGMKKEEYSIGKGRKTFCYQIEQEYKSLGYIFGATSGKFGVYYGKLGEDSDDKWRIGKKALGTDIDSAFRVVRKEIVALVKSHELLSQIEFSRNLISPMLKMKILSIYHPNSYLPIFSDDHMAYFVNELAIPVRETGHMDLQRALLTFKNGNDLFRAQSNMTFSRMLYDALRPKARDFKVKDLVKFEDPEIVELSEIDELGSAFKHNFGRGIGTADYLKRGRENAQTGLLGEKVVFRHEVDKLQKLGKNKLASKVKHSALSHDGLGYDICSFDEAGNELYIEVKSSKGPMAKSRYYLTRNELEVGKGLKGYALYFVSELSARQPKIVKLYNPFRQKKFSIELEPLQFQMSFKR